MVVQENETETFTDIEYSYRKKKTKAEEFLEIMEEIIRVDEWASVIEPCPLGESASSAHGDRKDAADVPASKSGSII